MNVCSADNAGIQPKARVPTPIPIRRLLSWKVFLCYVCPTLEFKGETRMSDLDQIKALDSAVADGVNSKNAAAVASQYTDDAAILPPGA